MWMTADSSFSMITQNHNFGQWCENELGNITMVWMNSRRNAVLKPKNELARTIRYGCRSLTFSINAWWVFCSALAKRLYWFLELKHRTQHENVKEFRLTSVLLGFFRVVVFFRRLFWCRVRQTRSTSLTTAGNSLRLAYYSVKN